MGKTIIFPHGRSRGAPCANRTYRKNTASGVVRCPPGAPVPHRTYCKNSDSGAVRCPRGAPLKKESACFAVVLVGAPQERPWGVINIIRGSTTGVPPSQGRRSNRHEPHHGTDGCPWFHGGNEKGVRKESRVRSQDSGEESGVVCCQEPGVSRKEGARSNRQGVTTSAHERLWRGQQSTSEELLRPARPADMSMNTSCNQNPPQLFVSP